MSKFKQPQFNILAENNPKLASVVLYKNQQYSITFSATETGNC